MWSIVLVAVLLWPGHGLGLLDGIPLDRGLEAVLIGAAVPALWWLHPSFTRARLVRVAIVALALLKCADVMLLTQQGWCVRFETQPLFERGPLVQTSWDARADWHAAAPRCSAVMSRPYWTFTRFPVWFLNLQDTRPPRVPVRMTVDGYVSTAVPATLAIELDGTTATAAPASIPAGVSRVHFDGTFTGTQWTFVPRLNGRDVFATALTTTSMPTRRDRVLGRTLPAVLTFVAAVLMAWWVAAAVVTLQPTWSMIAWTTVALCTTALAGAFDFDRAGRAAVALLLGAVLVSVPERLRNSRGAFLLIGVPWVALLIGGCLAHAGRITMYSVGDDWTTFQRFAHRIYVQGYWLEGGERGFWQQPLYRWIVGALHIVFGDSSIGEMFLDSAALLIGALFAVEAVRRIASFRAAIVAGVLTLLTIAFGPNWYIIGRGLSDAVAAGFMYAAALLLLDVRDRTSGAALAAGVLATLAFFTRLNYLPLILAAVVLMLPFTMDTRAIARVTQVWNGLPKRRAAAYLACIVLGLLALMTRTWHYLGQFSLFAGTTRLHNATGLGVTAASFVSLTAWRRALESVAMLVTVEEVPRLNVRAILVIAGVCGAVLAMLQVPRLRRLPLPLVIFCLATLSGGFVARGVAYPGRFSLPLIPAATATAVGSVALLFDRATALKRSSDE